MKFNVFFAIIIGLFIGIGLKLFIFDLVRVSGNSMEPTIMSDSMVVINKLAYGIAIPFGDELIIQWAEPKKGDIIVYIYDHKMVLKRCEGIAGEVLDYSSDSGYSIRVGEKDFPLSEGQFQRIKFDTVVPPGTVFAIGDNPLHSVDSRDYGFVPIENILGRIVH